jgi:hypothetical protein
MTIVSDDIKWHHNLEHHSRGIIYESGMFIQSNTKIIILYTIVASLMTSTYNHKLQFATQKYETNSKMPCQQQTL